MKLLNSILLVLAILTAGVITAQETTDAPYEQSGEPGVLPIFKKGFKAQISIAPQIAYFSNSKDLAYGAEIALQCPLACTKKNYIRQQLSILYSQDTYTLNNPGNTTSSNVKASFLELTLNPEYRFVVKPSFELAAGPSLGLANSNFKYTSGSNAEDIDPVSDWSFLYGASTSATFHLSQKVFTAVSARYNWTFSNSGAQGLFKLGYKL